MKSQELKKLETNILKNLKKLVAPLDTVILGVSGGPDSVFLLHFLNKIYTKSPQKIVVAHINHLTRGIETDRDEKFVKKLAAHYGNIFQCLRLDVPLLSQNLQKGLEETGRLIRYKFLEELAKKYKAKSILTAHHADDNLETIVMNFARGGSLKALAGIKEKESFTEKFSLIRPLLSIPKSQILDYLKSQKIAYRLDKSNTDENYTRNFIRQTVIPALQKINPNLSQSNARNVENLKEINDFMEMEALRILKKIADKKFTTLKAGEFRKFHPALQKQILVQLHFHYFGHTQNLEKKHFDEIIHLIKNNVGNKQKSFGQLLFRLKGNVIYLSMLPCKTYRPRTDKKTHSST